MEEREGEEAMLETISEREISLKTPRSLGGQLNQVSLLIEIVGNFEEKSFAWLAIFTATSRASAL